MTLYGGDGGLEVSALNAVGREVRVRLCYWSKASLLKKLSPHTQECEETVQGGRGGERPKKT